MKPKHAPEIARCTPLRGTAPLRTSRGGDTSLLATINGEIAIIESDLGAAASAAEFEGGSAPHRSTPRSPISFERQPLWNFEEKVAVACSAGFRA